MRIQTLSLFPEQIEAFASTSILCRAIDQELLSVEAIQIRNYAVSDYGKVDDRVYGGGTGMLLMADPVYRAWETAQAKADHQACTYYMSPKGTKLTQEKTRELALSAGDHSYLRSYRGSTSACLIGSSMKRSQSAITC